MDKLTCPVCSASLRKIPDKYFIFPSVPERKTIILTDILHNRCSVCDYQELASESFDVVHPTELFYKKQDTN